MIYRVTYMTLCCCCEFLTLTSLLCLLLHRHLIVTLLPRYVYQLYLNKTQQWKHKVYSVCRYERLQVDGSTADESASLDTALLLLLLAVVTPVRIATPWPWHKLVFNQDMLLVVQEMTFLYRLDQVVPSGWVVYVVKSLWLDLTICR